MEVAERVDEIDGQLACVSFAEPGLLERFEAKLGLPYPIYSDPGREGYRAFGFERAGWRRVWLDPRVWRRCASLLARGRRSERTDGNVLQLGGDAVLDARQACLDPPKRGTEGPAHRGRARDRRPGRRLSAPRTGPLPAGSIQNRGGRVGRKDRRPEPGGNLCLPAVCH